MTLYYFNFIMVYVQNSEILVLTFFSLSIFLFTFIEFTLGDVNDVVCLLFLSNESDLYIVYDNYNDTIKNIIYFYVMED